MQRRHTCLSWTRYSIEWEGWPEDERSQIWGSIIPSEPPLRERWPQTSSIASVSPLKTSYGGRNKHRSWLWLSDLLSFFCLRQVIFTWGTSAERRMSLLLLKEVLWHHIRCPLPSVVWWSRMSSPIDSRDSEANTPTRHRTFRKPTPLNKHEFFLASNSNQNAPSNTIPEVSPTRSILEEIASQFHIQENKEEMVKSWNRFTCKKIGVVASLKALALSSCAIYCFPLIIEYWHRVIKGWMSYSYWYHWLGCPAFSDGHKKSPLLVMLIHRSPTKYRLIVRIQSLSLQLYPWSGYLIMEENRCHTIWVKT